MWLFQGLDLSPYFLAVAQHKEKRGAARNHPIKWIHAKGEDTGLPSKSFDIVSIAYVVCLFIPLFSPTLNFSECCNAFSSIYTS